MAQRGGSVITQVRYGDKIFSPVVELADYIIGFEEMEALRYVSRLRPDGTVIVNEYRRLPSISLQGHTKYPEGIIDRLKQYARVIKVPAESIASGIGMSRAANIAILGTFVEVAGLRELPFKETISEIIKEKYVKQNEIAFDQGAKAALG
jgi:indolepyruvate ferredoxin oxidoreductase, beta subunit